MEGRDIAVAGKPLRVACEIAIGQLTQELHASISSPATNNGLYPGRLECPAKVAKPLLYGAGKSAVRGSGIPPLDGHKSPALYGLAGSFHIGRIGTRGRAYDCHTVARVK